MSRNGRRNNFIPAGFSIRRLLLQSARAAHGSPQIGQRSCDIEKGNFKHDKKHANSSSGEGSVIAGNSGSSNSNKVSNEK